MPSYDYLCQNCGHQFEHFQSMKSESLCKCPQCSKKTLKRLIGAGAGIIFKGSGFYQTDYRSDSYKSSQKSNTPTPPADKSSKTESTPKTSESPSSTPAKPEPKGSKKSA